MKTLSSIMGVLSCLSACKAVEPKPTETRPGASVASPTVIQIRSLGSSEDHMASIWLRIRADGEFERIDEGFPRGERRTSGVVPVRLIDVWRAQWERTKRLRPVDGPPEDGRQNPFWLAFDGEAPVEIPMVPSPVNSGTPVVSVAVLHEHELHALMMRIFDSTTAATASR